MALESKPEIGGLVHIDVHSTLYEFTIKSINDQRISLEEGYHIVLFNGKWQIYGITDHHYVTFISHPRYHFTGIDEIDQWTLLYMNPSDLFSMIKVNKQIERITRPDEFWRQKVERDFHSNVLSLKPDNISYRQQYKYLHRIRDINKVVEEGRLDGILVLFHKDNKTIKLEHLFLAIQKDHLHIVKWFFARLRQKYLFRPNGYDSLMRIARISARRAEDHGSLSILKWFEQGKVYKPDERSALKAINHGYIPMLEWLAEKNIFPSEPWEIGAMGNEQICLTLWKSRIPHKERLLCSLAFNGHLDVLTKLIDLGAPIDINVANASCGHCDVVFLEWLEERGHLPNHIGANVAIAHSNMEVVEWLEERKILPNSHGASVVYTDYEENMEDYDEVHPGIPWLEERRITPNSHDVDFNDCFEYV